MVETTVWFDVVVSVTTFLPPLPMASHSPTHHQQRSSSGGDRELRLALDCVLRCSRELCTHAITTEEFRTALDLILPALTPHPNLLGTPTSPQTWAEFGEVGQQRLASLSLSERRQQLAEVVGGGVGSRSSSTDQARKYLQPNMV